jgi:hypothetical protein
MRTSHLPAFLLLLSAAALAGCGDDDACTVGLSEGCDAGQICAEVVGGEPACFLPVEVRGKVFNATSDAAIRGATVVGLDVNSSARTSVATSADDGTYRLPVLMKRDSTGKPASEDITVRVAAAGYQPFPLAPRSATPINVGQAVKQGDAWVVKDSNTDVALLPLSGGGAGLVSVSGWIKPAGGGALVVAEQGGKAVSTAVSDKDGAFTLFNVPAGETRVAGYRSGLVITPVTIKVVGNPFQNVELTSSTSGLATVSGSLNIVDAAGGLSTSVLLVLASTFDSTTLRGEAPAGLRAGNVTGAYSITGVPPGKYVVLAAYENDQLVRDPDETIGGTAIVQIEVTGSDLTVSQGFKVTGALAVISPGANGVEAVSAATPVLKWEDDSSEDGYEIRIYDGLGNKVHEDKAVPRQTGSSTVSYTWTGASMTRGMIYQFRVVSYRDKTGKRTYISATEDLKGVFRYQPGS